MPVPGETPNLSRGQDWRSGELSWPRGSFTNERRTDSSENHSLSTCHPVCAVSWYACMIVTALEHTTLMKRKGVFVSQTDLSLMLTMYGQISSEFDSFENGSWLISSYILAMCVAQPLVCLPYPFYIHIRSVLLLMQNRRSTASWAIYLGANLSFNARISFLGQELLYGMSVNSDISWSISDLETVGLDKGWIKSFSVV